MVIVDNTLFRVTLMSKHQQAESIFHCSEIVTHDWRIHTFTSIGLVQIHQKSYTNI